MDHLCGTKTKVKVSQSTGDMCQLSQAKLSPSVEMEEAEVTYQEESVRIPMCFQVIE